MTPYLPIVEEKGMKKFAGLLYAVAGVILTNDGHTMLSYITKNAITTKGCNVPFWPGTRQFSSTKKYLPIVESVIDEIRAKDAAKKEKSWTSYSKKSKKSPIYLRTTDNVSKLFGGTDNM